MKKPDLKSNIGYIMSRYLDKCIAEHSVQTINNDFAAIKNFDIFLSSIKFSGNYISEDILFNWINTLYDYSNGRIHLFECIVNKMLRFAKSFGIDSVPVPIIKTYDNYQPYLFSKSEIEKICLIADNTPPCKKTKYLYFHIEFPMILRILISCGTRITETVSLQMKDVDLSSGVLYMRHCKENRERIVPMHENLREILEKYCMAMGIVANANDYLFPGESKENYLKGAYFSNYFSKVLKIAGIGISRPTRYSHGISTHCLRHSFACNALRQLQEQGIYVDNLFPYLSTYMGHKGLYDTQKYLKFTAEMISEETLFFEKTIKEVFECPIFDEELKWE